MERKKYMGVFHTQLEADGKIQLPRQIVEKLDLHSGNDLDLEIEENGLRVSLSRTEKLRRVQERLKKYALPGVSVVDEFIAERRREAENE